MALLPRHESSAPTVSKVYAGWFAVGECFNTSTAEYKDKVIETFDEHWAYTHEPFSAAACIVDPEFHSHDQMSSEEVADGFMDTVEKIGILLIVRNSKDGFLDEWKQHKELISKDYAKQKTLQFYPSYPTSSSDFV
uniref:Uncharacterized protein n=1 Tax=Coccolithus braarudii TaxID=221442 RepID=A0A7S0LJD2_9EUKA|mmetsp:Transcript_4348/g.9387  ORF Transcript_4348/g.9387 Transcript_4348/m.9387 type:complete len:136 (+) Transcript_4348:178-585(+)